MNDVCIRTPEAAQYLSISESSLTKMRMTRDGPPFVRVGVRSVAYRRADLDEWLQARVHNKEASDSLRP